MRADLGRSTWLMLNEFSRRRRVRTGATFAMVILGPTLAVATFLVLGPLALGSSSGGLRFVLLLDFVYILTLAALVLYRIAGMIAARRAHSAGSRLHLRLTGVFTLVALIPTVLVAVFAGLTVNMGLEGWFSERVQSVIGASLDAAEAYQEEQRRDLKTDASALAELLNAQQQRVFVVSDGEFRQVLAQGQAQIQRGLKEAYVIDGQAEIRARGERSYLFGYDAPEQGLLTTSRTDGVQVIEDWDANEFRALVHLDAFVDRYLLVSRQVDGDLLNLLDDTQQTAQLYQQLERDRGRMLFEFSLLYLGFAVMLMLAAVWLGLWFAERLSRPVGRLAGAAQQVGEGNLEVRVREEKGDDEIAVLGRVFNQMTRQLKRQRQTLLDTNAKNEQRRRLFDSVLSSVSAGVMGLDADGRIDFINRSGARLIFMEDEPVSGRAMAEVVPEFLPLLETLRHGREDFAQQEVKLRRGGVQDILLVRMGMRFGNDRVIEGFVVAFDDVTDLVSAQRMAAWGDVARRIAHEIKNPLTPIQLSAERINRKFGRALEAEDAEKLGQLTDVIVRQTGDLRRIVDEFSKFARMPVPEPERENLTKLVKDAVLLQSTGQPEVQMTSDMPSEPALADLDATLISRALVNVLKNACEAALACKDRPEDEGAQVRVSLEILDHQLRLTVEDNGAGFPPDRAKLFEPYVTNREGGTGLGLPIVKKIVDDHGGRVRLEDADPFGPSAHRGACVVVTLPRAGDELQDAAQ